ncbi:hypothetical protein AB395_00005806 (plasmid) [Sinorhizobium fredii CCBAU 45436]|nr:hypothetical protein AB395_00005806 [Sinorhizobium fredii CCBAU 45436]
MASAYADARAWSSLGYLVPAVILLGIGTYVNGACVFGKFRRQVAARFSAPTVQA